MAENNENTENQNIEAKVETQTSCLKELEETKDQLLRVSADFQNFKKRIEKERLEWIHSSQGVILGIFLPFKDDLERAIEFCQKQPNFDSNATWFEGFKLIQKNLEKTFTDLGVTEIDCSGNFNPDLHEAIMQVDISEHKTGQIVQILSKGYLFKGKVLRHAQVSVAK